MFCDTGLAAVLVFGSNEDLRCDPAASNKAKHLKVMKRKNESQPVLTATLGISPYAPIRIEYETLQDLMQSVWEIVYDTLKDKDFTITLHDGTTFPWIGSFASMCFDQGLIQVDEFIDFCREEFEIEKEQEASL